MGKNKEINVCSFLSCACLYLCFFFVLLSFSSVHFEKLLMKRHHKQHNLQPFRYNTFLLVCCVCVCVGSYLGAFYGISSQRLFFSSLFSLLGDAAVAVVAFIYFLLSCGAFFSRSFSSRKKKSLVWKLFLLFFFLASSFWSIYILYVFFILLPLVLEHD